MLLFKVFHNIFTHSFTDWRASAHLYFWCCCIKKCNLNVCSSRRKQQCCRVLWARAHLRSKSQKDSENVCCTPHFNWLLGKIDLKFSVPKTKGTIHTFISNISKSNSLSWYGGAAEQTARVTGICVKVLLTWRQRHILPSRWCLSWEVHCY